MMTVNGNSSSICIDTRFLTVSDEEMEVEEPASERTADGGMSTGSEDVSTVGDTNMADANGGTENGVPKKVKRKFLDRRARKNLPSKEDIANTRYVLCTSSHILWRLVWHLQFLHCWLS